MDSFLGSSVFSSILGSSINEGDFISCSSITSGSGALISLFFCCLGVTAEDTSLFGSSFRVATFLSSPRTASSGIFVISEIFTSFKSTIIGGCSSNSRLPDKKDISITHSKTMAI